MDTGGVTKGATIWKQQVNSIVKDVYGINYSKPGFIFEDKMPGRMRHCNKWKRTDVGHMVDGRSYSCQAKEPKTIKHRGYSVENILQATMSDSCDEYDLVISRPPLQGKIRLSATRFKR